MGVSRNQVVMEEHFVCGKIDTCEPHCWLQWVKHAWMESEPCKCLTMVQISHIKHDKYTRNNNSPLLNPMKKRIENFVFVDSKSKTIQLDQGLFPWCSWSCHVFPVIDEIKWGLYTCVHWAGVYGANLYSSFITCAP